MNPPLIVIDQGAATLLAAGFAALVSAISLIVTLISSKRIETMKAKLEVAIQVKQEKRQYIFQQLSEFYNPIYSLLIINRNIFERIGPTSETRYDRRFPENETAEVWEKLVTEVIIPNNAEMCKIIETKLYLLALGDNIKTYFDFITHAYAYRVFRKKPYEAYRLFQFPRGFDNHVNEIREKLQSELNRIIEQKMEV